MIKAGIIAAVVALVLSIGGSLLIGLCVPCISIFIGAAAGYLACHFEPVADNGTAAKNGAIAGAIGGIGALLGQSIGAIISGLTIYEDSDNVLPDIKHLKKQITLPVLHPLIAMDNKEIKGKLKEIGLVI